MSSQARLRQRRLMRTILLAIIVATLPCYCLGAVMLGLAREDRRTPATLTAQALPSQITVTSLFPGATRTLSPSITPMPSGFATPTQGGPLATPGQYIPTSTPMILPPTATPTFTFTFIPTSTPQPTWTPPVIIITMTPTATVTLTPPPTNTDSPTLTPTLTPTPSETPTETPTFTESAPVDPFTTPTQEIPVEGGA